MKKRKNQKGKAMTKCPICGNKECCGGEIEHQRERLEDAYESAVALLLKLHDEHQWFDVEDWLEEHGYI